MSNGEKNALACLYFLEPITVILYWAKPKEPKKEGRVITPPNLTLGPDCGESCIVVNGRCIEKHFLT